MRRSLRRSVLAWKLSFDLSFDLHCSQQARKLKLAKAMPSLAGWTVGSGNGSTGLSSADGAKTDYFKSQAQARKAHPGGKINSNKIEATYKFLKRKQEKGVTLSKEEREVRHWGFM